MATDAISSACCAAFKSCRTIHTFNVIGPEASVVITGGPANTVVNIQAWLFLH